MTRPKTSHDISKSHAEHKLHSTSAIDAMQLGYEPYSRPDISMNELNETDIRLLRKLFDPESKMVDAFRWVIEEYNDEVTEDEKLKSSVARVMRNIVFLIIVEN